MCSSNPDDRSGSINELANESCQILTVAVCVTQMVLSSPLFAHICSQISVIERLSCRKLTCDPTAFHRRFMRRAYIILIVFATPVLITVFTKPLTSENIVFVAGLGMLRAIACLALLQAFFYVDLLDYMLQSFVRHVDMRASSASSVAVQTVDFRFHAAKRLTVEIFHFKILHFNLWEISERINDLIGWTILAIFLRYFTFAIFNVHNAHTVLNLDQVDSFQFFRK